MISFLNELLFNAETKITERRATYHQLTFREGESKSFWCVKKVFRAKSDDGGLKCEKVSGMCDQSGCGGIL